MAFIALFLNGKAKNVKSNLIPLIIANYGRRLNIGRIAFLKVMKNRFPDLRTLTIYLNLI